MKRRIPFLLLLSCQLNAGAQTTLTNQRLFDTVPFIPDHGAARIALFRSEPVCTGCTVFLGNSITEAGDWKALTGDGKVLNRGIGGDITFGMLKRLDEVLRHKPGKVFLLIGVNDIGKDIPPAVIADNIGRIIQRIRAASPDTRLVLQTVLPVNPEVQGFPQHYDKPEKILDVNRRLAKVAENERVELVDLHRLFRDRKGRLRAELTNDGLHLDTRGTGYSEWVAHLRKKGLL